MCEHGNSLIHANVARMRAPLSHPTMAGFVDQVDAIDALANEAPGFLSQPTPPDEGQVFNGNDLLNLSIWESVETFDAFAHNGQHARVLERRAEWFHRSPGPNYVLYWAPADHMPTEAEVKERIEHLATYGATPYAFTFDTRLTVEEMSGFRT